MSVQEFKGKNMAVVKISDSAQRQAAFLFEQHAFTNSKKVYSCPSVQVPSLGLKMSYAHGTTRCYICEFEGGHKGTTCQNCRHPLKPPKRGVISKVVNLARLLAVCIVGLISAHTFFPETLPIIF